MRQIPSFEINQLLIDAEHSDGTYDPSQPLVNPPKLMQLIQKG